MDNLTPATGKFQELWGKVGEGIGLGGDLELLGEGCGSGKCLGVEVAISTDCPPPLQFTRREGALCSAQCREGEN